ncbi:nitrate- and nitrite sensing domain-containing protein, partial [Modestobacter roseus]
MSLPTSDRRPWSPARWLSSLRVRTRLLLIGGLPLLAFLGLLGPQVATDWQARSEAAELESAVSLVAAVGGVVDAVQVERGTSSVYLSSSGARFAEEMGAAREQLDSRLGALDGVLGSDSALSDELRESVRGAVAELDDLAGARSAVDALTPPIPERIGWYTTANDALLGSLGTIASGSSDAAQSRYLVAHLALLTAKEKAGLERAQLSNVFTLDAFAPGQLATVGGLRAVVADELDRVEQLAPQRVVDRLREARQGPEFQAVAATEELALSGAGAGGFGVDPTSWFAQATDRIAVLGGLESELTGVLGELAAERQAEATQQLIVLAALGMLITAAVFTVMVLVVVGINRALRRVSYVLLQLGGGDLTERCGMQGTDELSSMGRTLDGALDELRGVLSGVAASADAVAASSEELSASSAQISASAEET